MCIPVSPGVDEKPQVRSALSSGPFRVLGTNAAPTLDFPVANASVRSHSKKAFSTDFSAILHDTARSTISRDDSDTATLDARTNP
jgi:hypothetical protein